MKLWLVEGTGWGWSFDIVRAVDAEDAKAVAHAGTDATVTELDPKGDAAILWSWEHSPDTGD